MHDLSRILLLSCTLAALCGCDSGEGDPDPTRDGAMPTGDGGMGEMVRCDGTPDGFCPCHGRTNGSTRYLFCPDTVTWDEAHDNCTRFGFQMVRIDSEAEQDFVWDAAQEVGGDYWIGLSDQDTEGEYEWSDGTALGSYVNWAAMAPNNGDGEVEEDCVEILVPEDGRWNDRDCSTDYLDYICEGSI